MSNQCQFIRQTAAVLMACGLIASLLPGLAAADKADNQWGPGYRITDNGLRIDGIRADNPTNRVIYDNDLHFDAMDFAYLAAQDKLGRVDFKGFIVTRNSHQADGYVRMVRQYNHYRDLAIQSGLWVPEHIGGAKEPLRRPDSGKIDDTKYELSDGARLIIQQADASTPENPLIVFCGGQFTTVATALLKKPSIASRMIVFGAGQVENTYNSDDGWSAYVTAMRAPVVNMREGFARVDGGYDRSKKQYDPLPKNPLIKAFYQTKVIREKDAGIVDGGPVVWLFNQHLVTGAQRRDMIVPPKLNSEGRLLDSFNNVNRSPYGHLHLPDKSNNYGGMIEAMVDVLKDPRVWDPDYSAKPVPNQATKLAPAAEEFKLEEGFVRLDNGKDISGWIDPKADWTVVDGAIHLAYRSPGAGVIWSEKTHSRDCIVRLQYRASLSADSGVFIHGNQFQVRDYENSFPGTKKYAEFDNSAGQWNDLEFDITDGVATVKLNGQVIQESWTIGSQPDKGIGLQKEAGDFDYRYVRVKEKK